MNAKSLLLIIALLLAGILGVMIYKEYQPKTTGEKIEDAINSAGNDIGNALEDLGNDIQKNSR